MKLAALSVDLDEIPCYHAIHGLSMPTGEAAHAVYARAVARLAALWAKLDVPCTFFVIGRDLEAPIAVDAARALAAAGHELGNHSQNHRYDLTRLSTEAMRREVLDAQESIARVQGHAPTGFRAPGYTIHDGLFDVLRDAGFAYDSSVFPCPAYWAAKAAAIGAIALRGRESRSVVDRPTVLAAPADPYFPARPYWRAGAHEGALLELPIGVTRFARLPFIGTSVMMAGPTGARALAAMMRGRPLINLELHGIDLLDAADGLDALRGHQPDIGIPVAQKIETLSQTIGSLKAAGYTFVTLREAAQAVSLTR